MFDNEFVVSKNDEFKKNIVKKSLTYFVFKNQLF